MLILFGDSIKIRPTVNDKEFRLQSNGDRHEDEKMQDVAGGSDLEQNRRQEGC